jgi:sigma-B regulation protein RsbU (phosphoserine phosphatase)
MPDTNPTDYVGLLRLAGEISREVDLDGLLQRILTRSLPWMQVEACSIFLRCDQTGDLLVHSAHGETAPSLGALRVPAGKGIVGTAMAEKRLIRVDDAAQDARVFREADRQTGYQTRALLAAPLLDGEECLGVIEFLNPVRRPAFTPHDEELVQYFAGLVAAALGRVRAQAAAMERAALQRDLDLARELQSGLLPRQFPGPVESPGLDLAARLDPAKEVSGDLYDFFFIEPGRLCFVVGDVSGKGVAAGIFMAMARTLVRAIAKPWMTPAQILAAVNTELVRDNEACLFITMVLGIANTTDGRVSCGLGAHNPPVLHTAAGVPQFGPMGGTPLGLAAGASYPEWDLVLSPGDTLFVYTDGVTEALDEGGALFTDAALLAALRGVTGAPADALAQIVADAVARHVGRAERSDDTTMLVLRRREA